MDAFGERCKLARMISPVRSILSGMRRSTVIAPEELELANKANELIHHLILQLTTKSKPEEPDNGA